MRVSKFVTVNIIQGNYGEGWEDEACSTDRKEMREELKIYRQESRYPSRLIRRRVAREKYETGEF